ncbi:hypothetical protein DFS34DRAFT_631009 [Phlyctochytrium arcticum]|nr:hypothetical protein DFS34DRAFT_631009 [Phlyctochytrium arcticum]
MELMLLLTQDLQYRLPKTLEKRWEALRKQKDDAEAAIEAVSFLRTPCLLTVNENDNKENPPASKDHIVDWFAVRYQQSGCRWEWAKPYANAKKWYPLEYESLEVTKRFGDKAKPPASAPPASSVLTATAASASTILRTESSTPAASGSPSTLSPAPASSLRPSAWPPKKKRKVALRCNSCKGKGKICNGAQKRCEQQCPYCGSNKRTCDGKELRCKKRVTAKDGNILSLFGPASSSKSS